MTGLDETSTRHADLYRNSGYGDFTLVASGLPPVFLSAAAWADFDLDGDLDLLLAGSTGGSPDQISCVYRNDGTGALTDIVAGLPGVQEGSANWGDLNNDGRPDILLTGYSPPIGKIAKLLLGTPAGSFAAATTSGLPAIDESAADLGDFDNDGDLDVVLVGRTPASVARIYRSCGAQSNAPPSVVASLSAVRNNDRVTFSWSPANDDHSASGSGLSYNLRIGTTPGGNEITAAMSNGASGYRRLSQSGNAQGALSWTQALPDRRYYWSVQAIDPAYRGGPFAGESTIGIAMTQLASSFSGLYRSAVAWGDFDNDGDLDLLMAGTDGGGPRTSVYRNIGGSFLDIGAGLPGIEWCSVDWGDFDRDGDLDIALCGWNGGPLISRIYRNDGGVFTDLAAGLPGVLAGTVAWGDLDRDGDLDLLLAGDLDGTNRIARVYRNDAGTFVLQDNLAGVSYSSAEWGDYDGDGDLDLVVMGHNGSAGLTRLYRNINNRLIHDSAVSLPGAWEGSVSWGDYDRDGDPDLLLVGWTGVIRLCSVYNNAGGAFTDIGTGLPGISSSRAAWGDYDNDGDLDIATTGYEGSGGMSNVYRNDVGGFFDAGFNLPGLYYSAVAWGDYDNDGDLDLVLTGLGGSPPAAIYRNDGAPANLPPGVPVNPTSVRSGSQLTLSWSHANDDHTPFDGLSYNVRVGTTPGGSQIASAMSLASGWRSVARVGNARQRLSLTLTTPIVRTYWSVQAIDGAFKGSAFATEAAAVTDVETVRAPLVDALGPAAPSPLTDDSRIELALSQAGRVDLEVFDVAGHHVATLFRGRMEAGRSSVRWSARDGGRGSIAAGVYWLRMQTPRSNRTLKLVVMR